MNLSTIVEKINKLKPVATEEVLPEPVETYTVRKGRKRNAEEQLSQLQEEYFKSLLVGSIFILTIGNKSSEFSELAVNKFGCFSVSADSLYVDLVNRMDSSLFLGKESTSSLFGILSRHLEDVANETGIVSYPMLQFKSKYNRTIHTKEDFVSLAKEAINEQVGGEISGIYAVKKVLPEAILRNHKDLLTPIVMATEDMALAQVLSESLKAITPNTFLILAGKARPLKGATLVKEVDETSTKQALLKIKESVVK